MRAEGATLCARVSVERRVNCRSTTTHDKGEGEIQYNGQQVQD